MATASAGAFLLPLILGLCSIGFIFSAVIAVSPRPAAEIFEEGELMRRIGQSQTAQSQTAQSRQHRARRRGTSRRWGTARRPGQAQPGQVQPRRDEPGSLFRPHRPKIQP